ncbi:MAG: hypothetical protein WDZ41_05045 [Candidatus Babeliales bacterium]
MKKKLRHFFTSSFFIILISISTASLIAMQPGEMPNLEDLQKIFEELDEETLDALAKIGEEFIKEAEARGEDPFKLLGINEEELMKELEQLGDIKETETPELPKPEPKEIEVPKIDVSQIKQAREILTSISEKIASIRQKALTDRRATAKIEPFDHLIDDLNYFILTLRQEKLLKYLTNKEFEKLYQALVTLEHELNYLEPYFSLPETDVEGEISPYTMLGIIRDANWQEVNKVYQQLLMEKDPQRVKKELQKEGKTPQEIKAALAQVEKEYEAISQAYNKILSSEQAYQALDKILDSLIRAATAQNIIEESKKLLQRYEPEALKIKEEQEKLEVKARKEQEEAIKRRPPFTPPIFEPAPFFGKDLPSTDSYFTTTPSYQPEFGGPAPSRNGERPRPGFKPTEPGKPVGRPDVPQDKIAKDKKEKEEKAEAEKKKGRPTPPGKEAPSKIAKPIEDFQKEITALVTEIETKDIPGVETSIKELFKDFKMYLEKPFTRGYPLDELKKIKEMKTALAYVTNKFNTARKKLVVPKLSNTEQKQLQNAAKKIIEENKKQLDYFKDLYAIGIKDDKILFHDSELKLNKDKKALFFEEEMPADSDAKLKEIKKEKGKIIPDFIEAFNKMKKSIGIRTR